MTPRLCLVLALALPASAFAQTVLHSQPLARPLSLAAVAGAPLAWPEAAPPNFTLSRVETVWDEMPITYQRLTAGKLQLDGRLADFDAWKVVPDGPHSLDLTYRWAAGVQAYLAWFPRGTFLPSLENAVWLRYLKGLETRYGGPIEFEINDDTATNPQMLPAMGRRTRVVAFSAPGREAGSPRWSVRCFPTSSTSRRWSP